MTISYVVAIICHLMLLCSSTTFENVHPFYMELFYHDKKNCDLSKLRIAVPAFAGLSLHYVL